MAAYDRKPYAAASDVGENAPRGCTDVICSGLFLTATVAFFVLMAVAFSKGDTDRIIYGTDYMGNICGHGDAKVVGVTDWSAMKYLWYPITYDSKTGSFNVENALKLGVCVSGCPAIGDKVYTYGGNPNVPAHYTSLFTSDVLMNRCAPKFATFGCNGNKACESKKGGEGKHFESLVSFNEFFEQGFSELKEQWYVVLAMCFVSIILCFLWLFILRGFVKPMVVTTVILLLLLMVALGAALFVRYHSLKENHQADTTTQNFYLAGAIGAWLFAFLYLCLLLFIWKDIIIACDIIEEASKVPVAIPTMSMVPPVISVFILLLVFVCLFTAVHIQSAGHTQLVSTQYVASNGTTVTVPVTQFEPSQDRWAAHLYNLFMFLWTLGILHAISFLIIAMCGTMWYWSAPGDDKTVPSFCVAKAVRMVLANHFGTACFGALIVAIIQFIRFCMNMFHKRFEAVVGKGEAGRCILCCANCCLACMERIVKFINKNAYVMTCITGDSFIPAARSALHLLMGNLSVLAVNAVGEAVMVMGKLLITVGVTLMTYAWVHKTESGTSNGFIVLVVVAVMAYFISCVFINVFGVCIDTVLLCYCYDKEVNDGASRPHYFPRDLGNHLTAARERRARKGKGPESAHKPLMGNNQNVNYQ